MNAAQTVASLIVLAAVLLRGVPATLATSAWATSRPGEAAHLLVATIVGGTACLFFAALALATPLEPIAGGLSWLLSACDHSLHLAYLTPWGAPVVLFGATIAMVLTARFARAAQRRAMLVRQTRRTVADIVGLSTSPRCPGGAVVVADTRPDAWCAPGRLGRGRRAGVIVVTSGATRLLSDPEFRAVVAHEQAHLAGHHQRYIGVMTLCTAILHWLPGIDASARTLTDLLEMAADDKAAAAHGSDVLASALLALAPVTDARRPSATLAITGSPTARRIQRLLTEPPLRAPRGGVVAAGGSLAAVLVPALLTLSPAFAVVVSGICHT